MSFITNFDLSILEYIQEFFRNDVFDIIFPFATFLGNCGLIWAVIALICCIVKKTRKLGLTMVVALVMGYVVFNIIVKNIVARPRPFAYNTALESVVIELINKFPSEYSFPSGHTLSSFSSATCIFIHKKSAGIAAFVLAACIAFSRMYVCVHYPTDVLAGIIFGVIVGIFACFIVEKAKNKIAYKVQNREA